MRRATGQASLGPKLDPIGLPTCSLNRRKLPFRPSVSLFAAAPRHKTTAPAIGVSQAFGAAERAGDEIVGLVLAALGACHQVVHVDMKRVPTSRHDAAPVIAPQDKSADGRRDGLDRSRHSGALVVRRRAHVGANVDRRPAGVGARAVNVTDVLRIARRHLDYLRPDIDQLAVLAAYHHLARGRA